LPIAGEVVLDDECAMKAKCLGLDVVFDEIAEPLTAVELGTAAPHRRTAKQAKLHGLPLWCRVTSLRNCRRWAPDRLVAQAKVYRPAGDGPQPPSLSPAYRPGMAYLGRFQPSQSQMASPITSS